MTSPIDTGTSFLFLPATRLERLEKALASGCAVVVVDLEDAIAPADKAAARAALFAADLSPGKGRLIVRTNSVGTPWFEDDLAAVSQLDIAGVMLPKCETIADMARVAEAIGRGRHLCGLVETARGIAGAGMLAASGHAARLAFGSIDFAADLGCATDAQSLLLARSTLVLASRAAGLPAPLDGVTADYRDAAVNRDEAQHAVRLGFGGKLCIHPAQVAWIDSAFMPTEAETAQARRILATDEGVASVDGTMVDAPVRKRAEQVLARAGLAR